MDDKNERIRAMVLEVRRRAKLDMAEDLLTLVEQGVDLDEEMLREMIAGLRSAEEPIARIL